RHCFGGVWHFSHNFGTAWSIFKLKPVLESPLVALSIKTNSIKKNSKNRLKYSCSKKNFKNFYENDPIFSYCNLELIWIPFPLLNRFSTRLVSIRKRIPTMERPE